MTWGIGRGRYPYLFKITKEEEEETIVKEQKGVM